MKKRSIQRRIVTNETPIEGKTAKRTTDLQEQKERREPRSKFKAINKKILKCYSRGKTKLRYKINKNVPGPQQLNPKRSR
jgi:uncharacterized FlaG/YvyC family protein